MGEVAVGELDVAVVSTVFRGRVVAGGLWGGRGGVLMIATAGARGSSARGRAEADGARGNASRGTDDDRSLVRGAAVGGGGRGVGGGGRGVADDGAAEWAFGTVGGRGT